jgi:histidine ammonia-lyase
MKCKGAIPWNRSLDGEHLTLEQVIAVVYGQPGAPQVVLSEAAKVVRAADAVEPLLAEGKIVYGITTGFGAFKNRIIPPDQVAQPVYDLIRAHVPFIEQDTVLYRCMQRVRELLLDG